ncbi:MAG: hypothetical protein FWF31_02415 [Desulfobulbus sp.]|nr:hypothetical protein [Desulfobulbus sp.]
MDCAQYYQEQQEANPANAPIFVRHAWTVRLRPHKIAGIFPESLDNEIKPLKHQVHGFGGMEYFTLKLYKLTTPGACFPDELISLGNRTKKLH